MSSRSTFAPLTLLLMACAASPAAAQAPTPGASAAGQGGPQANAAQNCPVTYERLVDALKKSVKASGGPGNGGFDTNEWAVAMARDGTVCAVAYSGNRLGDQWLNSRAIAAQKANTANGFSLKERALATANLYAG